MEKCQEGTRMRRKEEKKRRGGRGRKILPYAGGSEPRTLTPNQAAQGL
jgi:hypothetical protein